MFAHGSTGKREIWWRLTDTRHQSCLQVQSYNQQWSDRLSVSYQLRFIIRGVPMLWSTRHVSDTGINTNFTDLNNKELIICPSFGTIMFTYIVLFSKSQYAVWGGINKLYGVEIWPLKSVLFILFQWHLNSDPTISSPFDFIHHGESVDYLLNSSMSASTLWTGVKVHRSSFFNFSFRVCPHFPKFSKVLTNLATSLIFLLQRIPLSDKCFNCWQINSLSRNKITQTQT